MKKTIATLLLLSCATGAWAQPAGFVPPTCTRAELMAAVDSYLAAQEAGDVSKMALADDAVYLENMQPSAKDMGLWNTALPIAHSRSLYDSERCRTFSEVIVTEGDHQYVIGTRLYYDAGKITRVDSLVTDQGDWLFNANAYLRYSSAEDWSAPPAEQRTPALALVNAANNYLDLFSDKFLDIPWGFPCARLEGGAYSNRNNDPNATCAVGIPAGILYIVNRDYIVDEEQGVVNVFCRFGNSTTGMPDSHTFRLVDGKIRNVHTLSVNLGTTPSPQAADDGSMIRAAQ
jgi:hypothetical protein